MKTWRHFLRGLASVLVIYPERPAGTHRVHFPCTAEEAFAEDARKLAGDWEQVGHDLRAAIEHEAARHTSAAGKSANSLAGAQ